MEHLTLVYLYFIAALFITNIPYVGKYIAVVNTLIHEAWHCIIALICSGKVYSISLFSDTSGLAKVGTKHWLARVLVAYAGYTGSSLSAVALSYALFMRKYELIVLSFTALLFICFILWIRNGYGIIWSISIIGLAGYILWNDYSAWILHVSMMITAIVLAQSISSAFVILKLSLANGKQAGDATSLADATFIPAPLWGLLFFAQSLYAAYYIYVHYLAV